MNDSSLVWEIIISATAGCALALFFGSCMEKAMQKSRDYEAGKALLYCAMSCCVLTPTAAIFSREIGLSYDLVFWIGFATWFGFGVAAYRQSGRMARR